MTEGAGEAVTRYVTCGIEVTGDVVEWGGILECALIDTLIELVMMEWMKDPVAFTMKHEGQSILHTLGHIFVQLGIGIAVQEEVRR